MSRYAGTTLAYSTTIHMEMDTTWRQQQKTRSYRTTWFIS